MFVGMDMTLAFLTALVLPEKWSTSICSSSGQLFHEPSSTWYSIAAPLCHCPCGPVPVTILARNVYRKAPYHLLLIKKKKRRMGKKNLVRPATTPLPPHLPTKASRSRTNQHTQIQKRTRTRLASSSQPIRAESSNQNQPCIYPSIHDLHVSIHDPSVAS